MTLQMIGFDMLLEYTFSIVGIMNVNLQQRNHEERNVEEDEFGTQKTGLGVNLVSLLISPPMFLMRNLLMKFINLLKAKVVD